VPDGASAVWSHEITPCSALRAVPEAPWGERFETAGVHPLSNTLLEELVLMSLLLSGPGYALLVEESSKGFDGGVVHRLLDTITTTGRQLFVTRIGKEKTIGPPYPTVFWFLIDDISQTKRTRTNSTTK
jgi:hypothetical protein